MRLYTKIVSVLALGLFMTAACDDYPVTTTQIDQAANLKLQKISGDNQTGPPGQTLDAPYVVKVVDPAGGAVPGVTVRFRIKEGDGGSLRSSRVVTDSAGNASVLARLPDTTGVTQTVVAASDSATNTVSFTSRSRSARAGASEIRIVAGDNQKGITRDTLIDALQVEVTNSEGVALADVPVKWKVVSEHGGSVRGTPTRTDSSGIARNAWRLGNEPGAIDEVIAWIEPGTGEPDTAYFSAEVTGVPDTIVVEQGAIELDNNFKEPELVVGDTVFAAPTHWSRKPFKAVVKDGAGRTVRGATLSWTVTSRGGQVGDEPENGSSETVKVLSATDGGITVWRKAPSEGALPDSCFADTDGDGTDELTDCWIGATLSMEQFPNVTPVTLDALVRAD